MNQSLLSVAFITTCIPYSHAVIYMTEASAQEEFFPGLAMSAHMHALTAPEIRLIRTRIGESIPISPLLRYWQGPNGERMYVDAVIGKHDWIQYALGIRADGHVCGLEILEYREAYGSEIRTSGWRHQFIGYPVQSAALLNQNIKTISGATLSSRHVTEGVERLMVIHELIRP